MPHILIPFLIITLAIGGILAWLRFVKGYLGLKQGESIPYPYRLSPTAIVSRLAGMDRRPNLIFNGRLPKYNIKDDSLILPIHRWDDGEMNMSRVAVIAHTWAQGVLAAQDQVGYEQRERAVARGGVVPVLVLFVCMILFFTQRLHFLAALSAFSLVWVIMAITAIPSQFREWKTINIAKNRLKEVGLFPQSQEEIRILNKCLSSLAWCRVAGFRHIVPK